MSGLGEIFACIGKVVQKFFEVSVDLISYTLAAACLLGSLLFPWRWWEIYSAYENSSEGIRLFSVIALLGSIFDLFAFPFIFLVLLNPWRIGGLHLLASNYDIRGLDSHFELRLNIIYAGLATLLDFVYGILGVFAVFSPFQRGLVFYRICAIFYRAHGATFKESFNAYHKFKYKCSTTAAKYGLLSLIDLVVIIMVSPCLLMPTLWYTYFSGFKILRDRPKPTFETSMNQAIVIRAIEFYDVWYIDLWIFMCSQVPHFFFDLFCLPFAFFAFFSLRNAAYITELKNLAASDSGLIAQDDRGRLNVTAVHWGYSYRMRKATLRMGFLGLCDILILPFLLPLVLFQYRYQSIQTDLDFSKSLDLKDVSLIFVQASLQLLDLIILFPIVPLLWISRIRWAPVAAILKKENVFKDSTSEVYLCTVTELKNLFVDVILALPALLILATHYRSEPLRRIWRHFEEHKALFHIAIAGNFAILIHDIFLLSPFLALSILVSPFRGQVSLYRLRLAFGSPATDIVVQNPQSPEALLPPHPLSIAIDQANDESRMPAHVSEGEGKSAQQNDPKGTMEMPNDIFPTNGLRVYLWGNILWSFLDIPTLLMSLVVTLTIWRANNLFASVNDIIKRHKTLHELYDSMEGSGEIVDAVGNEFLCLFRDIFFTLPMVVVVATLYRFPGMLIELLSKLSARALVMKPVFEIDSCRLECPDIGGPMICFNLRVNAKSDLGCSGTRFEISVKDGSHMMVIGDNFWESISATFGSTIAAFGRSMLPLNLFDQKGIDLHGLQSAHAMGGGTTSEEDNRLIGCWVKIDMGKTKRSTIIKKMNSLDANAVMTLQFESFVMINGKKEKVVLFRFSPTLQEVIRIMDAGSGSVLSQYLNVPETLSVNPEAERKTNLVNSFHLIVAKHFVEILLDVFHLLAFFISVISPWRFGQLLRSLLERESYFSLRIAKVAIDSMRFMDMHYLNYRKVTGPKLNECFKYVMSESLDTLHRVRNDPNYYYYTSRNVNEEGKRAIIRAEIDHLVPYNHLKESTLKSLSSTDGCEAIKVLYNRRIKLQDDLLMVWLKRFIAPSHYARINNPSTWNRFAPQEGSRQFQVEVMDEPLQDIVRLLLSERSKIIAQALVVNQIEIDEEMIKMEQRAKENALSQKGCTKRCGLFTRSLNDSRKLIRTASKQALIDIGFVLLFLAMLLTLFRALPLLRDLMADKSFSPVRYSTRFIITKHAQAAARDLKNFAKFAFFTLLIFATAVGIPSYLQKLPKNCRDIDTAAMFAQRHFKDSLWYLCELFLFIFYCRTYRLVVKSSLYAFLVPAACLAEGQPLGCSVGIKVFTGFVIWVALLAGSIRSTVVSYLAGQNGSASDATASNYSLLAICAALFGVLIIAVLTVMHKPTYLTPNSKAKRSLDVTWSHVMALLTGPIESLQLSAVIMYFFWNATDTLNGVQQLGMDGFSSVVMMWGVHGGGQQGYLIASTVASLLVIFWGILVAVPVAAGGEAQRRFEKISAFKGSPLYDISVVLLSRLFPVWLIATLMRASSCLTVVTTSSDTIGTAGLANVLSTSPLTSCGGGATWGGLGSLSLLAYFVITSTILHADDVLVLESPTNRGSATDPAAAAVSFTPLYAMLVRAGQLFVCAVCFAGFWTSNSPRSCLAPIIAICAILALAPLAFAHRSICSVAAISPLRSGGWVSVLWTALICLARWSYPGSAFLNSEQSIYFGWIVIYAISVIISVWIDRSISDKWLAELHAAGLEQVIEDLLRTCDTLLVEDALASPPAADAIPVVARPWRSYLSPWIDGMKASQPQAPMASQAHINRLRAEVRAARSPSQVALVLLELENVILLERLSENFLAKRNTWIKNLSDLIDDGTLDIDLVGVDAIGPNGPMQSFYPQRFHPNILVTTRDADQSILAARGSNPLGAEVNDPDMDAELQAAIIASMEQSPSTHVSNGSGAIPDNNANTSATEAVQPPNERQLRLRPGFKRLIADCNYISKSIRSESIALRMSKAVLSILLSRHLPTDICWVIYSYCVNVDDYRDSIFGTNYSGEENTYSKSFNYYLSTSFWAHSAMGPFMSNTLYKLENDLWRRFGLAMEVYKNKFHAPELNL